MQTSGTTNVGEWLQHRLKLSIEFSTPAPERKKAEGELDAASLQAGYGVALTQICANKGEELGVRQLAAVLLKAYVRKHWTEDDTEYTPPLVPEDDRAAIRSLLPPILGDEEPKIRTAAGMALALIAASDWPEKWPSLMDNYLLPAIANSSNPNLVAGAVRCISLFSDDIGDGQIPALVPKVFPAIFAVISNPTVYDAVVRRRALYIFHSSIATLGIMSSAYQEETKNLIAPLLPDWMKLFSAILSAPFPEGNPPEWGIRMEVLRSLTQIILHFPSLAQSLLPEVLAALWQSYVSGLSVFERCVVLEEGGEGGGGSTDEDGGDQSLSSLCVQAFEFLISLIGNSRFRQSIEGSVEPLVYFALGYLQITHDQEVDWGLDINKFVEEEDNEALSCRTSGALLLEELVVNFEEKALSGVAIAVQRRLQESAVAKAEGKANWWKIREAAIFAAGTLADNLLQSEKSGKKYFDCPAFLDMLLSQDLGPGGAGQLPFLYSRCLWAAAKFASLMSRAQSRTFLEIAIQSISPESAPAVKVGGVRALSRFCPNVDRGLLRASLPAIYGSIGALLSFASEESLHLVLDLLETIIRSDTEAAAEMEGVVSPALFRIWEANVTDPVISSDASDALEALADAPNCIDSLMAKAVPALNAIFTKPLEQSEGMVEGAMDLLTMLLRRSSTSSPSLKAAFDVLFGPLSSILLESEDHSQLQNGAEALTMFVRKGGEELLKWSQNPTATLLTFLKVSSRLLHTDLDPSAALFVGPLLTNLLRQLPNQMAPHQQAIVKAVVDRMAAKCFPSLSVSLLLVLARVIHLNAPNQGQILELLAQLQVEGYQDGFSFVLAEWSRYQGDIQGRYHKTVVNTALILVLESLHPKLPSISVQGRLVSSSTEGGGGMVTRAKARVMPDKWSQIPFPAKALSLLAQSLIELSGEDEEDDVDEDEDEEGGEFDDAVGEEEDDGDENIEENESLRKAGAGAAAAAMKGGDSSSFAPAELFSHLLDQDMPSGAFEDEEEDEDEGEGDPLNKVELAASISTFLKAWSQRDGPSFSQFTQELSSPEAAVVKAALK